MKLNRRQFCTTATSAVACAATASLATNLLANPVTNQEKSKHHISGFIKFIQELSYDKIGETMAGQGYQGAEATIRPKGLIEPKDAPAELPKLVEALKKHNLDIAIMTTRINEAGDPVNEALLKTAADLGIKSYRMDYYRYDKKKPIAPQIDGFRKKAEELAKLNEKLGITALYQNHAGSKYLGSTMWDLRELLKDISPDHMGMAFDIRHATAASGESWPIYWSIAQPHVKAVYVKDCVLELQKKGVKSKHVPLGEGYVNPEFCKSLAKSGLDVPISLHVEYLPDAGLEANIEAMGTDLKKLHSWLGMS